MRALAIGLFLTTLMAVAPLLAAVREGDDEEEAIREIIEHYFQGDRERDVGSLKKAFHGDAKLLTTNEQGELRVLTQPEWHERVRQTPDRERPESTILHVDRTGNAAIAKTRMVFSNGQFTDFLSLLKIEGRWIVVHKIYHWEDR